MASAARQAGNEGRARVCARRAAGLAAAAYLQSLGAAPDTPSAYDSLKALTACPQAPKEAQDIAGRFLIRVTPDFELPAPIDLIQEARRLASSLFSHVSFT